MKPTEQIIAIAEACGLTIVSDGIMHHLIPCGKKTERDPEGCLLKECPDYLNDLNAMHEAEKIFDHALYCRYINELCDVTIKGNNSMYMATAAQRAEAFLRTIDKWID